MTRRTLLTALVWGSACAAASGCGGAEQAAESTEMQPAGEPASEVASTYAPSLNVDLQRMTRSETGLYTQDLQPGSGEPVQAGQTAVVHYTGWLPDGKQFDSSHDQGEPFPVTLGTGQVIPGWDQGLVGMRVGGKRRLVIPPALAYGNEGAGGVIPPGATLVFDVELVEVR